MVEAKEFADLVHPIDKRAMVPAMWWVPTTTLLLFHQMTVTLILPTPSERDVASSNVNEKKGK
jgi:hypothetical protein